MKVVIRSIGNSKGMIIPAAILAQVGLTDEAELIVEDGQLVVRPPARRPRTGWAEASKAIADAGDDGLVMPGFSNALDEDLKW